MRLPKTTFVGIAVGTVLISVACSSQGVELVAISPVLSPSQIPFHPTLEPNTKITASALTPDGSFWYAFDEFDDMGGTSLYSQQLGLYRSKKGQVSHFDIPGPIRVLEVAPDGSLYVGAGCGLLQYTGDLWKTLANTDCSHSNFNGSPFDIAFAENGDVWVGAVFRLARFHGQTWIAYDIRARRVLVAPDGSIWTEGWDGVANSDCCFTHLTGDTWVTYTHSALLPVSTELLKDIQALQH